MSRRLTPRSSLEQLKKDAKRWLKALHEHDAAARARLVAAVPDAPATPRLRDVQLALARELGFPGWAALKRELETIASREGVADDATIDAALVHRFLDNACPDHHVRGGPDHLRARHTAMRLLARHPAIAHASFATAVVCGDLARVVRMLADDPTLATRKTEEPSAERSGSGGEEDLVRRDLGPKGWEPLLYLCFTRLPLPAVEENAVAIAAALLDHGADPDAYFLAGGSRYTPLVGAIGEGEEDRPPHPQRDALVRLLLDRGAEPYDMQVVYDIGFHGRVLWFLQAIHARAVQLGRQADWDDPEWSMLGMGNYGSGARWHLDKAVKFDDAALAEWCLSHGASANAAPARDARFPQRSLYEDAVRLGRTRIAELLLQHGATPVDVAASETEAFVAACLRLDEGEVRRQLAARPELLQSAEPLIEAAKRDRVDVARFLLDLGMSPDVENETKERALHHAGYSDAYEVATLLLERGAAIDPVESNWGNTPLGAAQYAQHQRMIDLFARTSRDVWTLTMTGKLERLREVLAETPERARVSWRGHTPLMWLPPQDEALALEIARLLLALGADATLRNEDDGMSAAERAERMGMLEVARVLREGGG